MVTIVAFLILLGILVLVHEVGHFQVARRLKIGVEEFGLGFPPRLASKIKDGIVYSLNWVPLGGFVKIKGENGDLITEPDSFSIQPFWKKFLVLVAGVAMNIVLGWFLLSIGLIIGLPGVVDQSVAGKAIDSQIQITQVLPKSAAATAGLHLGDIIKNIDGQTFKTPEGYVQYIQSHSDKVFTLEIERKNQKQEIRAQAQTVPGQTNKILGVNLAQTGLIKYSWWRAPWEALKLTGFIVAQIFISLAKLIGGLVTGHGTAASLSGPVGVAVMTGQMVDLGFRYLLQFAALLSLNLAVINILPIPALDGGRILFIIIEKIRRKPNRASLENAFHQTGFALLLILVALITYKDLLLYTSSWWQQLKNLF
ncbi:MAG: RIP metalloprotease RseP [Candidatus Komeilibacteria bacterium]|nr:RIP metalloprotease RseP [Candidatus Komeilibacteria bacterium]